MAPPIPQASAAVGVCMTYGCPHQPARYPRGVAVNCGMAQVCTLCCLSGGGHVYGLGLTGGGRSLGVVTSDLSIGDIVAGDCAPDSCGLSRWRGAVSHCWTKTAPPASERQRSVTAAVRARPGFPSLTAPPLLHRGVRVPAAPALHSIPSRQHRFRGFPVSASES